MSKLSPHALTILFIFHYGGSRVQLDITLQYSFRQTMLKIDQSFSIPLYQHPFYIYLSLCMLFEHLF